MSKKFDSISDALDIELISEEVPLDIIEGSSAEVEVVEKEDEETVLSSETKEEDFSTIREYLLDMMHTSKEGLEGALEAAHESGNARSYEVVLQGTKSAAEVAEKLAELYKHKKDIDEESQKKPQSVTNNAVFVGTTSNLQDMIRTAIGDTTRTS